MLPKLAERSAPRGTKLGPYNSEHTVYFDYPRLRFDWRGDGVVMGNDSEVADECLIYDSNRTITYAMPHFPAGRPNGSHHGTSNPHAHNVLIDAKRDPARHMMDPRQQPERFSAAEEIEGLRRIPDASLKAVSEPDGLIHYYGEARGSRGERWVSADQGYCLVAWKSWNPRFEEPVEIYEGTVRSVGNGAYVVEHGVTKSSIIPSGADRPLPHSEEEITLLSIDLATPPDEKLFTLDGLDLPPGTKIQDRVEGRTYQYAVAAVKEHDIKSVEPSGPMKARPWATAAYLLAGIALVSIGFITQRFRRRK